MNQLNSDKREYELSFLLKERGTEAAIETLVVQYGGEAYFKGPIMETRLAYPIKKQTQAYFGYLHFKGLPDAVEKLLQSLRLNQAVLRVLLVTPPIMKSEKSARDESAPRTAKITAAEAAAPVSSPKTGMLTNEALEEKLEEILK